MRKEREGALQQSAAASASRAMAMVRELAALLAETLTSKGA